MAPELLLRQDVMTVSFILFGFLAFIVGSLMMILATGYWTIGAESDRKPEPNATCVVIRLRSARAGFPVGIVSLEQYLAQEQDFAASFVLNPSIESLYRQAARPAAIN